MKDKPKADFDKGKIALHLPKANSKFPLCEKYRVPVLRSLVYFDDEKTGFEADGVTARAYTFLSDVEKALSKLEKENKTLMDGASVCKADCIIAGGYRRKVASLEAELKENKVYYCGNCAKLEAENKKLKAQLNEYYKAHIKILVGK
jgi:hypothetical protein